MAKGKKSRNGSGSIWERKDGRWGASLTYPYHDPATGRTKRRRISTTAATWEVAHEWLTKAKSDRQGKVARNPGSPRLSEYLSEWLADVVEPAVAPKTYEKREYHVRVHLIPGLGHDRLEELAPRRIHGVYVGMARAGLAASTRRDIHTTLKMALKQAVRWGLIPQNPVDLVDPPRATESEATEEDEEIRTLSDEQARRLFAATEGERWHNYYVAAIRTGLRPGELLGLQWGDLDLAGDPGSLRVRRTLGIKPGKAKDGGGAYTKPPKSAASRRTLALHWEATDALAVQRVQLVGENLPTGTKDLVFPNTLGRPQSRQGLLFRYLRPALADAGLPPLTLHEMRHSFASIMLYEWRVGVEVVSKMLGHASVSLTLDVYGHLLPDAQESAIRALARLHQRPKTGFSEGA